MRLQFTVVFLNATTCPCTQTLVASRTPLAKAFSGNCIHTLSVTNRPRQTSRRLPAMQTSESALAETAVIRPLTLSGCCECRVCTFSVTVPDAQRVPIVDCHCPSCRKHAAAALTTWLPAMPQALSWLGKAPKKVRTICTGHGGAVTKVVCPDCFSVPFVCT